MSVTLDDDESVIYGLDANGRPDPEYARGLGILPASAARRSAAFSIDAAIVLLLTLPLSLGTLPLWLRVVLVDPTPSLVSIVSDPDFTTGAIFYAIGQGLLSLFILVQVLLHGLRGVTVGKAMVGIRSVNVARFTKPGFWRIVLRAIVFWAALAIIPIIGAVPFLLSPLWDSQKRGRGWLDKIGRNWLIDIRHGLDPFDQKALRHARRKLNAPEPVAEVQMPSLATGASGAVTTFVPAARSRSGVISTQSFGKAPGDLWQPPPVGEPALESPTSSSAPTVGTVLRFDDGMCIDVTGMGILGRSPAARDGESADHIVPLVDETMRISKTHASFGIDERGFWVEDRGSSNGTDVVPPGGAPFALAPWKRCYVAKNSVVEVGGRSFTVIEESNTNGRLA